MTRNSDLKKLVRARMVETGQNYTASLQDLQGHAVPAPPSHQPPVDVEQSARDRWSRALAKHRRLVGRVFDGHRFTHIPPQAKKRTAVLLDLVAWFEPARDCREPEVNNILGEAHEDVAWLRRELVMNRFMTRVGGVYRLAEQAPSRGPSERDLVTDWERLWLPDFLAGRVPPEPGRPISQ